MALMQKLVMKQGQSLVMTPQLQQAIKLLQMSNIEVQNFIDAELERNPLLERNELRETAVAEVKPEKAELQDAPFSAGDARGADGDGATSPSDGGAPVSQMSAGPMPDSSWTSSRGSGQVSLDGEAYDFAANVSREETLAEHLTAQLFMHLRDPADILIGQHLIGTVNEAGYLTSNPSSIANTMGTDVLHVERVLSVLKKFDPVGVFAADLKDCLRMQLLEQNRFDPAMDVLLDHLPLVAKRDYPALKNLCHVGLDDIHDMITELRALNPKPGYAFGSEPVMPVVPDVSVRSANDGSWMVELNSETLPRVLVNNQYAAQVSRGAQKTEDKLFLSECQAQASWLVKSLDQRAKTIL